MRRKDRQARRILSLFEHLHQLEAVRLTRLEAEARDLKEEERRLILQFDGDGALTTIFPDLVLNKLRSTIERQKVVGLAVEKQAQLTLERAKRVKQGEKLVAEAERAQSLLHWQRELSEIVDSALKTTGTSSR